MYIALHAGRKIEIDYASDTLKVDATRHDLSSYHNPRLSFPHPCGRILTLLVRHSRVQTIHIKDIIQDEVLGQRRRTWLRGGKNDDRWGVRLR